MVFSSPAVAMAVLCAATQTEPPPLWVRLTTPVQSANAATLSNIEAIVTAPFRASSGTRIPVGSVIKGSAGANRNRLRPVFDRIRIKGVDYPMRAHVAEVDNAREKVTPDGTILALDALRKKPGKAELILMAAAYAHPAALAFLEGSKLLLREVEKPSVHYPVGTDIALQIESAPQVTEREERPATITAPEELTAILRTLPKRTETYQTRRPSDWVNLAFAGDRQGLIQAFESAGWRSADQLSLQADIKVFLAVAHHHSYQQAPVSRLSLAGRLPELVFQKQTNTFAKRHHIRIWATDQMWEGQPLWIGAATHDIGIEFSARRRTFSHRIDPEVDREREKVANDLLFADAVRSDYTATRREIPAESQNATGDSIRTDGNLRVLALARR